MNVWGILAGGLCWAVASVALADAHRFAVIIGNDRGRSHEAPLRFAVSDAERVHEVLRELGGFRPADMVLLRNERAETVRDTLLAVNERVRSLVSQPQAQALLFVYYSGHADAEALHLGETSFAVRELAQIARGSAADFRLVVLDACRSGAVTRLKGGDIVEPFALAPVETIPNDGLAFLSASTADESAQESDELRSSFFTHALVSGLLGAADRDGDGEVTLQEVYRHAYENTLRASSRTLAGLQHPTFRYDFRGQGELVLTSLRKHAEDRAEVRFPAGIGFLVMKRSIDGPVIAEIGAADAVRSLSMAPDRYFVVGRGPDILYEGSFDAAAGTSTHVDPHSMRQTDYARLIRKGGGARSWSHGPEIGARARTAQANASGMCFGGFVGYAIDARQLGARVRAGLCAAEYDTAALSGRTIAYDLDVRVYHAWDVRRFTLELGIGAGVSVFRQSFDAPARAPARSAVAPFVGVGGGLSYDFGAGVYVAWDLAVETYLLRLQGRLDRSATTRADLVVRAALSGGKRF